MGMVGKNVHCLSKIDDKAVQGLDGELTVSV